MKTTTTKNTEILKTINFLIDIKEEVYWSNTNYNIVRESNGNLLVVCKINGFTSGLTDCDLSECGTHKWAIRENDLFNFKHIN